jgi:hypothetical protein
LTLPKIEAYFFPSLGLKKLVNLFILLVLTFFKLSTPLEAGCAFLFVPALAASDLLCVIGAEAAIWAAVRFDE